MRPHRPKEFAATGASELGAQAPPTSVARRLQMPRLNADFDATSAIAGPAAKQGARRSGDLPASARGPRRERRRKDNAIPVRVLNNVRKLFPNRDRTQAQSS